MKKIKYSPKGIAVPDSRAEEFMRRFLTSKKQFLHISTDNCIWYARLFIKNGFVKHDQLMFEFNDYEFLFDRDARLNFWPPGFLSWTDKILARLLGPDD